MNSRHLKVSYQSAPSQQPYTLLPPMPFLRLQGRWLDAAGFAIEASVRVQVEPGRLVLEVIEPQAETG
jgi:Toxin SymE, type I toxin-antitoxin system